MVKHVERHLAANLLRYAVFLIVLLVATAHIAETAYATGEQICRGQHAEQGRQ
jgi:hypothetical protein